VTCVLHQKSSLKDFLSCNTIKELTLGEALRSPEVLPLAPLELLRYYGFIRPNSAVWLLSGLPVRLLPFSLPFGYQRVGSPFP